MSLLTAENYFSRENQLRYQSASQFKALHSCQAAALAEIRGEYAPETSVSLLVGSYVDAHFSGTLNLFRAQHPEIFTKSYDLKSDYRHAEYIIARIERDPLFMEYISGEQQVILTGTIAGVPFKVMIDSLHPDKIVDRKIMKDFANVWVDGEGKLPFIEAWGYDIQGAVYQEVVRQNRGIQLPFFIAGATKEKEPDIDIFLVPQDRLDYALDIVNHFAPDYEWIKQGRSEPERCGRCDYCKMTKVLTGAINYREAV